MQPRCHEIVIRVELADSPKDSAGCRVGRAAEIEEPLTVERKFSAVLVARSAQQAGVVRTRFANLGNRLLRLSSQLER